MAYMLLVQAVLAILFLIGMLRAWRIFTGQQNAASNNHNAMPQILEPDGCTDKFCVHGECIGHEPEWEVLAKNLRATSHQRLRADRTLFCNAPRCCGKKMTHHQIITLKRCKKCRVARHFDDDDYGAFCECCGKKTICCVVYNY